MNRMLKPWLAKIISSEFLLNFKRRMHELKRRILKQPHLVSVFVRVDDPYSYLLLQVLLKFERRYQVEFNYYVVSELQQHMYPEPRLWHENALRDSSHIAELYNLDLPVVDQLPDTERTESATAQLLILQYGSGFVEQALTVLKSYWSGQTIELAEPRDMSSILASNNALLDSLGHYLSATLHYGGEWYWGIDRLGHLERRLNSLRLSLNPSLSLSSGSDQQTDEVQYDENTRYFCQRLQQLDRLPKRPSTKLTIYFSARSPYSYLGLERGVALAKHYGVPIEIKPVLPMLMRGMLVPSRKKWYILADTKREALKLGLDYGFIADPLGEGVERCYALFEYAESNNRAVEYLLAFARGVNAQAVPSDTDNGMKLIVENADLDWIKAKPIMDNCIDTGDWRVWAERNYQEMHAKGLWGVPCFEYGGTTVWGQDRIDVIERVICDSIKRANL